MSSVRLLEVCRLPEEPVDWAETGHPTASFGDRVSCRRLETCVKITNWLGCVDVS